MESFWRSMTLANPDPSGYTGIHFWSDPDRVGWLTKQGEIIKTWRRRYFVLKQGKLLWFKDPSSSLDPTSIPRGVINVPDCLTVKGAEDAVMKANAFELSNSQQTMYFVADSEKEKEEWVNAIGRSIISLSRCVTDTEVVDYDSKT